MGSTTNQITSHIENTREDLGSNIRELEDKVKSVTDWRRQFDKNPMTMIGVAFGGGILLGAMMHGRKHNRYSSRRLSGGMSMGYDRDSKMRQTWGGIKGALLGVATTRVKDFIGDLVPGFQEHYDQAVGGRRRSLGSSNSSMQSGISNEELRDRMSDPVGV